jgi:hypothetical protein
MDPNSTIRRLAWMLAAAGLLPFFAHALFAWTVPASEAEGIVRSQAQYAAVILAFVGALHWGLALAVPAGSDPRAGTRLLWSVVPSIYAWIVTLYPPSASLPLLLAGLLAALGVDLALYRGTAAPRWFLVLRVVITAGAALCLGATWLALSIRLAA